MARKDRVKPTHYPVLPFHAIRCAQLVSSIIVASIMSYFMWELQHDNYGLPWTFILVHKPPLPSSSAFHPFLHSPLSTLHSNPPTKTSPQLLTVSLLTLLALSTTIVLHCFYGLNPLLNTLLNAALLTLWAVSFALLSWWSSGTLAHVCNRANWDSDIGISICRIYKALFSFSLFGLVATLLALVLDVHVQRGANRRGRFAKLQLLDNKREFDGGIDGAELVMTEREANPNPMARGARARRGGEGYALPEEQFAYDEDTGYHGAGGQVGRRSLGERF
ncbi:hypothetical protein BU26DRAFT_524402 [Trematosphaeria pertusa]|uniref:MARVEL domain-containing protein n=1 Tax=Trematosphaeria pertusa TaxID=390896 RepID=A0A6A6HWU9_9PLEO|nr:uncharacterized protein BU26DRAFT_524402 [Trematosphaeria pertusa]KAF2242212.1 hypothetical protein BU26DRAFT_524402 [Trematosphaeria pertusa]